MSETARHLIANQFAEVNNLNAQIARLTEENERLRKALEDIDGYSVQARMINYPDDKQARTNYSTVLAEASRIAKAALEGGEDE